MEFEDAERLINGAYLLGSPSLIIMGKNGIGKTELLNAFYNNFKKTSVITNSIDYGGLKEKVPSFPLQIKIVSITDLQYIMQRKTPIRQATLGQIGALIDGTSRMDLSFKSSIISPERKFNFIIGATPRQVNLLIKYRYEDFLDRFLIIPVERSNYDPECFKLSKRPLKKYLKSDLLRLKTASKNLKLHPNPRTNQQILELGIGQELMGNFGAIIGVKKWQNLAKNDEKSIGLSDLDIPRRLDEGANQLIP